MINMLPLVSDYKANVPLKMLEAKYGIPIHTIIHIIYKLNTRKLNEIR